MNIDQHIRKNIDAFFAAIGPIKDAFQGDTFSYVAVKSDIGWVIIQARLLLNVQSPGQLPLPLQIASVRAGHFMLSDAKTSREAVVENLLSGKLDTPDGVLLFPPNSGGQYSTFFQPYHDEGLKTASRLAHLTLYGGDASGHIVQPDLDWGLRAAPRPFDGLQDVLNEYQPGVPGGTIRVEIVAFAVANIDYGSVVEGEVAKLGIRAATAIDTAKISVGYRILEKGRATTRAQLAGNVFEWSDREGFKFGTTKIPVPPASVIHAIVNYNDVAQQHYYFGDPLCFQNPRRAAYEASDPKLSIFDDILAKAIDKRGSDEFEAAIPWLFWMLGFAPASLSGSNRLGDAPDGIITSPAGHIVVLECTVGLLKEDRKLPNLYERACGIRRNLERSNLSHIRVLPVIVTAKTLEEIEPDIEAAEKLGVYIITREDIDRLKVQTLVTPNADLLYEQAEQAVSQASLRYVEENDPDLFSN